MPNYDEIAQALISGNVSKTEDLIRLALSTGLPAVEVLNKGLIQGMTVVGDRFRKGEFFLPEVLLAGETMKTAMAVLKPSLQKSGQPSRGRFAIGTVKSDIHDIGKNLVIMMFEGNGWEVTDLGVDVPTEQFVSVVKDQKFDILGLSALLTTTIPRLEEVIRALQTAGLRDKVKVMVGGVAVTRDYANKIGADGYAPNAVDAVDQAELILKNDCCAGVAK
jgi:5-methyltetrahydrofolate--homocysteine methyltransferase